MKISIYGLGYVGCVNMACLAADGFEVIGVDVDETKVDLINSGKPTIVESEIDDLLQRGLQNGLISSTTDKFRAVRETDVSIICVGTPNAKNGLLNLDYVLAVAEMIGEALKNKESFHTIAVRSTVTPGANAQVADIIEERSGKQRYVDFDVVSNPEFLREGSAVADYRNPPVTVIGAREGSKSINVMRNVYKNINAEFTVVDIMIAEIIKYVNNSWHAVKIVFANEVGNICKQLGIDSHKVIELFGMDAHLNISTHYMKSGFAYGGSCLPKDLLGLISLGRSYNLVMPLLENVEISNEQQLSIALRLVLNAKPKKIALLGLSFKDGTDDLRYSPNLKLAKQLDSYGYNLTIYDPNVYDSIRQGINESGVRAATSNLYEAIKPSLADAIENVDTIIIGARREEFKCLMSDGRYKIIDLVRLDDSITSSGDYNGLCW